MNIARPSVRSRARIAGMLYVLCIVCGFFAEGIVRARLIVYTDAAATAGNILTSPGLFRMGFFADVAAMTSGVLSSVIVYTLLKPVSRTVALTVLVLDVISNTVSIGGSILLYAPLTLLNGGGVWAPIAPAELQALALLSIKLYELVYAMNLALFSGSCLLTGYLIYRSTFLPRFLGMLLAVAGVCYFVNSVVNFMPLGFGEELFPWILLPCLLGESALALWLLVLGVNESRWRL